eukprot:TRINITY_DN656_c0_g1_i1.p1 TRINITY_DN656_c0_g1~~TRINITY_DN656_c0_g1_i1.p1  ORF type:complete len:242 (-),score=43.82 TRINITY_DN656_c0_g1_i1:213-938(-)
MASLCWKCCPLLVCEGCMDDSILLQKCRANCHFNPSPTDFCGVSLKRIGTSLACSSHRLSGWPNGRETVIAEASAEAAGQPGGGETLESGISLVLSDEINGLETDDPDDIINKRKAKKLLMANHSRVMQLEEILSVFNGLLERPFGSGESIAAAGRVVIQRVTKDLNLMVEEDQREEQERLNQQVAFEMLRVMQLMSMDMQVVAAAKKTKTLLERLKSAQGHCEQAIRLARVLPGASAIQK